MANPTHASDFQNVCFTMEHNLFFRGIHSDQNWQGECFCWSQVTWELYLSNLIRDPFGIRRKDACMVHLKIQSSPLSSKLHRKAFFSDNFSPQQIQR